MNYCDCPTDWHDSHVSHAPPSVITTTIETLDRQIEKLQTFDEDQEHTHLEIEEIIIDLKHIRNQLAKGPKP